MAANFTATCWISLDGYTWAPRTVSPDAVNLSGNPAVAFGNGRFVVVSNGGMIAASDPVSDSLVIATQPAATAVNVDSATTLSVAANGAGVSYQWYRGMSGDTSSPVVGATSASFTTGILTEPAAFWVRVTNPIGSIDSTTANIAVRYPPVIMTHPVGVTASTGASISLGVTATGTAPLSYQWLRNGVEVAGATNATLAFSSVQTANAGTYTVRVTNVVSSVTSSPAVVAVNLTSALRSFTLRGRTGTGAEALTGVFMVEGAGSKPLLVRAVGPSLVQPPLGTLVDPQLQIFDRTGASIVSNNNWGDAANAADIAAAAAPAGTTPLASGSADAAVLRTYTPGVYGFRATGADNASGIVGFELHETDTAPRVVYIASRCFAGSGAAAQIAGIVVGGTGPRNFLVRAVGPSLGIPGALADPKLEVWRGGTSVAVNDNWDTSVAIATAQVGAFPLEALSKDAALLVSLVPGAYTINVTGVSAAGVVLLELFEVDSDRATSVPPVIVSPPANATGVIGGAATLKVLTTALPSATFQWRKDGVPIPGATSAVCTLTALQRPASIGNYDVVVSGGAAAAITSAAARLDVLPAEISALSPATRTADNTEFTLDVIGQGFVNGSTVRWGGVARATTFESPTLLRATILGSDVGASNEIKTVLVTVISPAGEVSNAKTFTVTGANVSEVSSSVSTAGSTVTVSTAGTSDTAGVTAVLDNTITTSTSTATVAVANYTANAASTSYFDAGGGYVDVQVTGVDATARVTSYFYYPSSVMVPEENVVLLYYDGVDWRPVLSSGGVAPTKNMTNNLDGTTSGGRFTVIFDNTSTPAVTALSGTIITTSLRASVSATPSVLYPPSHQMVPITISVKPFDPNDGNVTGKILSVTCNEPVIGPGSGRTDPDFRITGALTLEVRSERSGTTRDRIYTVTVEVVDGKGRRTVGTTTVTVPHDKR